MATIPSTTSSDDAFGLSERRLAPTRVSASSTLWRGAAAGASAALVASAAMLWAGRSWGGALLAQLLSDRITILVPLDVFRRALESLESDAKPFTLLGLTLAQVLLGAVVGALYARVARPGARERLLGGGALALLVWLGLNLVAAPLGDVGVFAKDVAGGVWTTQATFVLAALLCGGLTALLVPAPRLWFAESLDPARRRLIVTGVMDLAALFSVVYIGRYVQELRGRNASVGSTIEDNGSAPTPAASVGAAGTPGSSTPPAPLPTGFAFTGMPPEVTPIDDFYIVSKNFVDPTVDTGGWSLEVSGLVNTPLNLSFSDLSARPSTEFTSTLECISNTVGGNYISTGVWQGFPLATLLNEAGLQEGIVDIELHAADGYVESIPLDKALEPDVMLVHTLDGAPLPDEHGKPARLIVPNIYGMKNVKWLTKIAAVNGDVQGYWQNRGWSDIATVNTMSRIDTPRSGAQVLVNQPIRIGGIAFAGFRGISAVELSTDGGKTWNAAELSPEISALTWRLWAFNYTPTQAGNVSLVVRATDGTGAPQDKEQRPTLPDGATGYDTSSVKVVDAS